QESKLHRWLLADFASENAFKHRWCSTLQSNGAEKNRHRRDFFHLSRIGKVPQDMAAARLHVWIDTRDAILRTMRISCRSHRLRRGRGAVGLFAASALLNPSLRVRMVPSVLSPGISAQARNPPAYGLCDPAGCFPPPYNATRPLSAGPTRHQELEPPA